MVMTHLILRSRWTGWRLVAAVFFIFYGVTTFMPQIESAVFLTRLPPGTLPRLFLAEYYGGVDPGSFVVQMRTVIRNTPWLIPFQIVRAMCWVALALPVIRMLKGKWPEPSLSLGLLFAVVMNVPLLLPNPYMPEQVRMAHLVETASSNLIFGIFIGWLLTRRGSEELRVAPAMS
jgi:hypothetical protein